MKDYKKYVLLLVVISIFLLFFSIGYAQEKVWTLKLGATVTENNDVATGIKKFVEIVEEKSEGRIKFDTYFGGSLGTHKTQLENVISGLQDIYAETYTYFQSYVPGFGIHAVPFFFKDNDEYRKFLLSPIEADMEKELLEKTGLRIICEEKNWLKTPYRVIISRRPIQSLEDLKGLKLRQPDAPTSIKVWGALGAIITITPWSEVYLALQQGMVDAITAPISSIYDEKFYEVAKYATVTNEYMQQVPICINNKKFESFPEDLQNIIIDAANEAGNYCTELIERNGVIAREEAIKQGVTIYEFDLDSWRNKAAEAHKELEESGVVPAGLMDEIKDYLSSLN